MRRVAIVVCAACRRIAHRLPAGCGCIDGTFAAEHRAELLQLMNHHAARAQAEHPVQRLMSVDTDGGTMVVTTTDLHLARKIGSALRAAAFRGTLGPKYSRDVSTSLTPPNAATTVRPRCFVTGGKRTAVSPD
jgi:hypothetical protein